MLKGRLKKFPNFPERIFLRNGGTGGCDQTWEQTRMGTQKGMDCQTTFFCYSDFFYFA